jgi:enoyl-CoA hydratase/carnithine racemase
MTDSVKLAVDGVVATLLFDRPGKRNAIDLASWQALPERIADCVRRKGVRAIVLRGAGGNFAAGAAIDEFDTVFATRESTLAYAAAMIAATQAIAESPLPTIAMVEGLCIGAGVAVALACDLRFAAAGARFAVTPARLGLMYSFTDTRRLADTIGKGAACDLIFSGRTITAAEALAIGLVDAVFEDAVFEEAAAQRLAAIAEGSPWTIRKTKSLLRMIAAGATAETDETRAWFAEAVETADFRAGIAAFRARAKPVFPEPE